MRRLKYWVCVDAFIVLSGTVLTGFVGVTGLARRLAMDGCLPQVLLKRNRFRDTNHYIIGGFLLICISLYLALAERECDLLANVYSISFLCVMSLFAIGNMLLKHKRADLPRQVRASWGVCLLALSLAIIALVGVIVHDTSVLTVWLLDFVVVAACFSIMLLRSQVLRLLYHSVQGAFKAGNAFAAKAGATEWGEHWFHDGPLLNYILHTYRDIVSQPVIFFVDSGSLSSLNKAILYCRANEETQHVRLVHVYDTQEQFPPALLHNVAVLDEQYPRNKVDLLLIQGHFGPELVAHLSEQLGLPRNRMFMECPKTGQSVLSLLTQDRTAHKAQHP